MSRYRNLKAESASVSATSGFKDEKLHTFRVVPIEFPPYNWLTEAKIYNKKFQEVTYEWLEYNADLIVAFFNANGIDYKGLVKQFYSTYENAKIVNLPIEVIYIPMDETEEDFSECFEDQANWFTLKFGDQLIPILTYMYGVSSLPHLVVLKVDGTVISYCGFTEFEEYGKNVLITWLASSSSTKTHRRLTRESIYEPSWSYLTTTSTHDKPLYQRKYSVVESKLLENPLIKGLAKTANSPESPEDKAEKIPEDKGERIPKVKIEGSPEPKEELEGDKSPEVIVEKSPEIKEEVSPEVKPEATTEEKTENTPEVTPEGKLETIPEVTPEGKLETIPEVTPEDNSEGKDSPPADS